MPDPGYIVLSPSGPMALSKRTGMLSAGSTATVFPTRAEAQKAIRIRLTSDRKRDGTAPRMRVVRLVEMKHG